MLTNRVKERRVKAGLTQDQLATLAHTTRQTVIAIEKGRTPTVPLMLRLAEALKVRPDELFFSPGSNSDITPSSPPKGGNPRDEHAAAAEE